VGRSRAWLLGQLSNLLGLFLGNCFSSIFKDSWRGLLRLGNGGLCSLGRLFSIGTVDLGSLLELLVHLIGVDSLDLHILLGGFRRGNNGLLRGRCLWLSGRGFLLGLGNNLFLVIFVDVSEHVIEDEVARGLLGKNESLDKLLGLARLV
jgi:hypothetical protein